MTTRNDDILPDGLRDALRTLRPDAPPGRDLWPGIAARIARTPTQPAIRPIRARGDGHRRPRHLSRYAVAASIAALALAGASSLLRDPRPDPGTRALMLREAESMTRDYRDAWQALDARRSPHIAPGTLREIDRGAAQVRAALQRQPDSRDLFDRLQHLYERRLDLARRFASPGTA